MTGRDERKKDELRLAGLGLGIWGMWLVLEDTYFGAGFYGFAPPPWLHFFALIPLWLLNLIDTIGVVLLIFIVFASVPKKRRSRDGNAAITGMLILVMFIVFLVLMNSMGVTLADVIQYAKHFFG